MSYHPVNMPIQEFTDSTLQLNRPNELISWLDYDGYLFFRGLLPREGIVSLRSEILNICADAGWLMLGSDALEARADPARATVEPEPPFLEVYRRVQRLQAFHTLAHHPTLISLIDKIIDGDPLPHPNKICRLSFPGNVAHTTPAHQDFPFIQGSAATYTAWIPLGDCPRELGGLAINPETHKQGVLDHHLSMGAGGMGIDQSTLADNWHSIDYEAGDVLLFHSHVVHKALPNLTGDRLRLSVDYRYQSANEPIAESNLHPHTNSLTWSEVYQDWDSTELQFYWRAADARVTTIPLDMSLFERRDAEAWEAGEFGDPRARAALSRIAQRDPDLAKRRRARELLERLQEP
jgi:hypothetical protein